MTSENLALTYQEVFTAIERLRSGRQAVADANTFRQQVREALSAAENDSRKLGYAPEEIRLSTFALVAFLDESILNLQNPVFQDWARKPLQEEYFGGHNAGEIFFNNLQRLMTQNDSPTLADVLEVYQLCILLGYGGRYSLGARGELQSVRDGVDQRIRRIRGPRGDLSPAWKPMPAGARAASDPWLRPLTIAAIVCACLALVAFLTYKVLLNSGVSGLTRGD